MPTLVEKLVAPGLPKGELHALFGQAIRHLRLKRFSKEYRAFLHYRRVLRRQSRRLPGVVVYDDKPIAYADTESLLSAWQEIFIGQIYDIGAPAAAAKPLLVDVGANIGLAPLYWKQRYGDFDYIGFEADPQLAKICNNNLRSWGCGGSLHATAVAAEEATLDFFPDSADGGSLLGGSAGGRPIAVNAVKLSSYITREVDLLKIDIEGAEHEVLQEIQPCLHWVKRIFVEVHSSPGRAQMSGQILLTLQNAGFRCFIRPARAGGRPFHDLGKNHSQYDDQFNVFGVRGAE
jgi:FkbM family methyltransferase